MRATRMPFGYAGAVVNRSRRAVSTLAFLVAALVASCSTPAQANDAVAAAAAPGSPARCIVLCAPGMPGNTVQAQPTMERFAKLVETTAGWPAGKLGAVYYETEKGGVERLGEKDAALAIVPLPFFLEHAAKLGLKPILQVEGESGSSEEWSLIAKKGRIVAPAALAGWEIAGMPGYSPAFVRGPILGKWGAVPATAKITFSPGVLSPLRKASSGEPIAVILDRSGASSLGALPFGKDLEIVTKSRPLPATIVCVVGDRLSATEASKLADALLGMARAPGAGEILTTMRIRRFVPVEKKTLDAAREAFTAASAPAKP